jgi:hypothetical protein
MLGFERNAANSGAGNAATNCTLFLNIYRHITRLRAPMPSLFPTGS